MVYIPSKSPGSCPIPRPGRKPTCLSRKSLEIFEDRIFQDTADLTQPITPTRNLHPSKGLSAPVKSFRQREIPHETSVVERLASQTKRKPEQIVLYSSGKPGAKEQSPSVKTLRRPKTLHDLRSSIKVPRNLDDTGTLRMSPNKYKRPKKTSGDCLSGPFTRQEHFRQSDKPPVQRSMEKLTDTSAQGYKLPNMVEQKLEGYLKLEAPQDVSLWPLRAREDTDSACQTVSTPDIHVVVELQNLDPGLSHPADFFQTVTRLDPNRNAPWNIHTAVQRIDVTTGWKNLSSASAEDLYHSRKFLKHALETLLDHDLRGILSAVEQQFHQRTGDFAFQDGFRVAIHERWVPFQHEKLVEVMMEQAHDWLSEKQHQPARTALMQLYLTSTDCFLDWASYTKHHAADDAGLCIQVMYDQMSKFEAPVATARPVLDYVEFINLNLAPREDQELVLVPRYCRNGVFVSTRYPKENVTYVMETPISWLGWDDNICGFKGRVPTYSAFRKQSDQATDCFHEGGHDAISHVLDITIQGIFTKYCTVGPVYFVRKVRTRLTLGILPIIPSSNNSVYGIECHRSMSATPANNHPHELSGVATTHRHARCGLSHGETIIGDDSDRYTSSGGRSTPHELDLPKRAPGLVAPVASRATSISAASHTRKTSSNGDRAVSASMSNSALSFRDDFLPLQTFTKGLAIASEASEAHETMQSKKKPSDRNLDNESFRSVDESNVSEAGKQRRFYRLPATASSSDFNSAPNAAETIGETPADMRIVDLKDVMDLSHLLCRQYGPRTREADGLLYRRLLSPSWFERTPYDGSMTDSSSGLKQLKATMLDVTAPDLSQTLKRQHTIMEQKAKESLHQSDVFMDSGPFAANFESADQSSDSSAFESAINSLNSEEEGSVRLSISCMTPVSNPKISAVQVEAGAKSHLETSSFRRRTRRKSRRQQQSMHHERLGLEEEIALQKAIEKSREEQLQRRMAADGFDTFFDDIFDVNSVGQESDPGSDGTEKCSDPLAVDDVEGMLEDIEGLLRVGVDREK